MVMILVVNGQERERKTISLYIMTMTKLIFYISVCKQTLHTHPYFVELLPTKMSIKNRKLIHLNMFNIIVQKQI